MGSRVAMAALVISTILMLSAVPMFFTGDSDGSVTYTPSPAEATEIRQLEIEVTATFPDGQTMTAEVPLTVAVDPVFDFTNNPSDGTLAGEVVT